LGTRRFHREVFEPYADPDEGEVIGALIDDFANI
jgi:hypothetical protein